MRTIIFVTPLLIASLLLVQSCEKDPLYPENSCDSDCITFEGQVYDINNEVPVEGVLITVEHQIRLHSETLLGTTHTDAQGYYSYTFPGTEFNLEKGDFRIYAEKQGYIMRERNILGYTITEIDTIKTANFDFFPAAKLEIRMKIVEPGYITSLSAGYNHCDFRYGHYTAFSNSIFDRNWEQGQQWEWNHSYEVPGDGCINVNYSGEFKGQEFSNNEYYEISAGETIIHEINIE